MDHVKEIKYSMIEFRRTSVSAHVCTFVCLSVRIFAYIYEWICMARASTIKLFSFLFPMFEQAHSSRHMHTTQFKIEEVSFRLVNYIFHQKLM